MPSISILQAYNGKKKKEKYFLNALKMYIILNRVLIIFELWKKQ